MIEEKAQVIRVAGEFAWVHTQRESACGQCSAQKGCGTSVFSKLMGNKFVELKVMNPVNAEVGDSVILGLHESVLLKSAIVMYLMPLLTMFASALVAQSLLTDSGLQNLQFWIVSAALMGLVLGFVMARRFSKKRSNDERYQPVILRRAPFSEQFHDLTFKA